MFKKILEFLKPVNLQHVAITVLVICLLVVGYNGYKSWEKSKAQEEQHKQDEETKKKNNAIIEGLHDLVASLARDVVKRDKDIVERDKTIVKKEAEKKAIREEADRFKAAFHMSSQEDKDKTLEAMLKDHEVITRVVAKKDYMEINPKSRENLGVLVIDYDKLFKNNAINEDAILPGLNLSIADFKKNERDLKISLELERKACDKEKENLNIDIDNLKEDVTKYKKKAFWSKVGGIVALILSIVIFN